MPNTPSSFFDRRRSTKLRPSEFWPDLLWQVPLFLQGFVLGLLRGKLNWFVRANPGIPWGGMFDAPKSSILQQLRPQNRPQGQLIQHENGIPAVPAGLQFPLIVKPDAGERGRGVYKIGDQAAWTSLWQQSPPGAYLVQNFVPAPYEFGVFVIRDELGRLRIHSLTWKLPLGVVGDGHSSLEQLLAVHPRAQRFKRFWPSFAPSELASVPNAGAFVPLHFSGNHSRGATFLNAQSLIDADMEAAFNDLLAPLEGFYYGRLDAMVAEPADLRHSARIQVLEINGANAEPAHVYDPDGSWWVGLLEHFRFQRMMWRVANRNLKAGAKAPTVWATWEALMAYQQRPRTTF